MRKLSYTKAVIICHGKSEVQICKYIKQNLRLSIEISARKNGSLPIQINSLKSYLNNDVYKNLDSFINKFSKVNIVGEGKNQKIENFKFFIIMDTDDCTKEQREAYSSKEMFKDHWAYEYIVPIYNITNLEDVLKNCSIKCTKNTKNKTSTYIRVFPTDPKYTHSNDRVQLTDFRNKIEKCKYSNMDILIDYCLKCKPNNKN
ncbi:hypothetical protein [Vallitalea sp.]|jgi:hypothetical protein|uniref:hypothetical protein n=1 Tax=Vallitalea sp. TaxID=1882829 RepID=UPI0025F95FDC|nr:hypothetical protein [Vallitalea sp.]MCT4688049.1 hypothetical protein [Vallitalea sp.]